jgi:hypothetical protein
MVEITLQFKLGVHYQTEFDIIKFFTVPLDIKLEFLYLKLIEFQRKTQHLILSIKFLCLTILGHIFLRPSRQRQVYV